MARFELPSPGPTIVSSQPVVKCSARRMLPTNQKSVGENPHAPVTVAQVQARMA